MPAKLAEADQMTIEEFLAMTAERPDGERWELIEGVAIMNASPTQWHQTIASNIVTALMNARNSTGATWQPMLGVGTRVPISPRSLPQPDVYVQSTASRDSPTTDDAMILFEVLSRSNRRTDQTWRKKVYASILNCEHYVTVSMKAPEIVRHDRVSRWQNVVVQGIDAELNLPAIGFSMQLRDVYLGTPIT